MRCKLSHSSNQLLGARANGNASTSLGAFAVIALMLCAGVGMGCNRIDSEHSDSALQDVKNVAETSAFEWPVDPAHQVLTIQIESPAVAGEIHIELMPELAPLSVAEITDLAGDGFYDGTTFHRVIRDFMIQGGDHKSRDRDPTNDGKGGRTTPLVDEFGEAPFERGVVGIANTGRKDSNSSQFFILHKDSRYLDGRYSVIGRVVDGMDVVDEITQVATDKLGRWGPKDRPIENVVMKSVQLTGQIGALIEAGQIVVAGAEEPGQGQALGNTASDAAQTQTDSADIDTDAFAASN